MHGEMYSRRMQSVPGSKVTNLNIEDSHHPQRYTAQIQRMHGEKGTGQGHHRLKVRTRN